MISSNIRVPEDLWNDLKKIANKEERSMNSQIIYIIKKYIEENKTEILINEQKKDV